MSRRDEDGLMKSRGVSGVNGGVPLLTPLTPRDFPAGSDAAPGLFLQLVDHLRRLGLGELVVVDLLAGLLGQGMEIRALGAGHRLVARHPVVGVLDHVAFGLLGGALVGHPSASPVRVLPSRSCTGVYAESIPNENRR